jgi:hypothetical protein
MGGDDRREVVVELNPEPSRGGCSGLGSRGGGDICLLRSSIGREPGLSCLNTGEGERGRWSRTIFLGGELCRSRGPGEKRRRNGGDAALDGGKSS